MLENINKYIDENYNLKNINFDILFVDLINLFYDGGEELLNLIIFIMIDRFGYDYQNQNDNIKNLVDSRTKQSKFREDIIKRDNICLITGDPNEICEACHIIPFSKSKSYDINNGLLFNKCFHKLFDLYLFSINSNDCVEFSKNIILNDKYKNYHKYNNKKINLTYESKILIKEHYNIFKKINNS